ncbi:MAG: transcriptional repressor [Polyangiaceae bacterium]
MRRPRNELSVGTSVKDEATLQRALERFKTALHEKKLRFSAVRESIARAALSFDGHFEVNDLLAELRQRKVKDAHLATVYRTLPLLMETGLIQTTLLSSPERHFYEPAFERPHHDQLDLHRLRQDRRVRVRSVRGSPARSPPPATDSSSPITITSSLGDVPRVAPNSPRIPRRSARLRETRSPTPRRTTPQVRSQRYLETESRRLDGDEAAP